MATTKVTEVINEMILLKVKENGIVNLINEYTPDKYLVITENRRRQKPLVGKFMFEDEVTNMLNIKTINDFEKKKLGNIIVKNAIYFDKQNRVITVDWDENF